MNCIDTSLQQNNATGGVYAWTPYQYQHPGSFPHPAAMSHNVDVSIWNHPGEGISQLYGMSAYTGGNEPHIGNAFPNNGMNMPNSVPTWGTTQPMRIPTTQAPSTAGVPAVNFELAANQHGTFQGDYVQQGTSQQWPVQQGPVHHGPAPHSTTQQMPIQHGFVQQGTVEHDTIQNGTVHQGPIHQAPVQQGAIPHGTVQHDTVQHVTAQHGQSQYGHDQHPRIQQGPVNFIKVENGTEQHMPNSHGFQQPAPSAPRASVNPESSYPLQGPGNRHIEAITSSDDDLGTVDPRDIQLIPEDDNGLGLSQWLVVPPQQSQAVNQVSNLETRKFRGREVDSHEQQYPDPAAQHEAHMRATQPEFPSLTSHEHLL